MGTVYCSSWSFLYKRFLWSHHKIQSHGWKLMVLSLDFTLLPKKGTNAAYLEDSRGFMTGFFL